jgi:hypothetical protein
MKKRPEDNAQERILENSADTDSVPMGVKERIRLAWLRIPDRVVHRLLQPLLIIFFAL